MLDHPLVTGLVVAPAADRADIERIRLDRFQQGQVVELGIVRQGHHASAPVGFESRDHVVRHVGQHGGAGDVPGAAVFLARIAHRHREAAEQRHGRQVFRQLSGADQQHPVFGSEGVDDFLVAGLEARRHRSRRQPRGAIRKAHGPLHQLAAFERLDQLRQAGWVRVVFEQQFQRAATRQAKTMGLVGGDAVLHESRRTGRNPVPGFLRRVGLREAVDQVVLDAAAGDGADHGAVFAQRHDRADRPRRRAPGAHHGRHQRALARHTPVAQRAQHHHVEVFHWLCLRTGSWRWHPPARCARARVRKSGCCPR